MSTAEDANTGGGAENTDSDFEIVKMSHSGLTKGHTPNSLTAHLKRMVREAFANYRLISTNIYGLAAMKQRLNVAFHKDREAVTDRNGLPMPLGFHIWKWDESMAIFGGKNVMIAEGLVAAVDETYRNRGIGTMLRLACFQDIRERYRSLGNAPFCSWTVDPRNQMATALWSRFGCSSYYHPNMLTQIQHRDSNRLRFFTAVDELDEADQEQWGFKGSFIPEDIYHSVMNYQEVNSLIPLIKRGESTMETPTQNATALRDLQVGEMAVMPIPSRLDFMRSKTAEPELQQMARTWNGCMTDVLELFRALNTKKEDFTHKSESEFPRVVLARSVCDFDKSRRSTDKIPFEHEYNSYVFVRAA